MTGDQRYLAAVLLVAGLITFGIYTIVQVWV